MNKMKALALVAGFGISLGAPAIAKVNIVQSPSAALVRGSTFAWAPISGTAVGMADPAIANEITGDRLDLAVETTLASKGYRQVQSPMQAQLLVSYHVMMTPRADVQFSGACGVRLCRSPASVDTDRYTQGMLVLDLVERSTGKLVYRASSEKRLSSKDTSQEKLNKLLQSMTKSLPM